MSDENELRELFHPWSGSLNLTVIRADWRSLRELYGKRPVWELRKRGKVSHKNRRKRHG